MKDLIGTHDLLFVTLDTLRYDVAAELAAAGRTPNLARALPGGTWEARHSPASFTYAAHQAFFAGFLPTPTTPGPHPRLFAAASQDSTTTSDETWVFDAPDVVRALAAVGYHTVCVGGVGFFNQRSPLGSVLPGLFAEAHWEPEFGVSSPRCFEAQLDRIATVLPTVPPEKPLFLFVNVAAIHQPNRHYLPGAERDSRESHAAALEYVDRHIGRLFALVTSRDRPCLVLICSDHGTAYGEEGHSGHRLGHEVVWTVPYGQFVLKPGDWGKPGDWVERDQPA
ncbi:STM4013/SEN3800 family hydrolase [Micromonospora sp. HM5-17]|uniref:STM4013/SEN3800 family hydrolase n=1 Tax=Micromonospora sp. HM5-17 TaxID=2487710 RepID=UPI000F4915B4|nr:STM4013/SEN3800 family hydrolase [Micromonospora sp. HM5-17]ROT31096.1 metalloenzyme domain-containing protein [Micromonospora sp. HM5-17]